MCLKLCVRKYLHFYAENIFLSKPVMMLRKCITFLKCYIGIKHDFEFLCINISLLSSKGSVETKSLKGQGFNDLQEA